MTYLSNQTKVSHLSVGGVDYTSSLVEWIVSDQSAIKNGTIQTSGTMTLGSLSGDSSVEDYARNDFRRGTPVILDITDPGGAAYRHPRGYLYVISTSYDIENEQLKVELGCRLVLISLTEEIDDLVAITPVALDVAQTSYQNCSAAFASIGQYVYQDNTGSLVTGEFFDGDGFDSVTAGEWLSILGLTTTAVSPLQSSGAIPDLIELSYQVPDDGLNEDGKGRVDTTTTESYYFTKYPAMRFARSGVFIRTTLPNGEVTRTPTLLSPVFVRATRVTPPASRSSGCGNNPPPPNSQKDGYWLLACVDNWETVQEPLLLPAYSIATTITEYSGPAAQVSRSYQEVRGPAIEANGQYWADKYAYCRSLNAVRCLPDGDCPIEGMNQILLSYATTVNYYGAANELVRTVVDTYYTVMSAAKPEDWRSGVNKGVPLDFSQTLANNTSMYRATRTDTTNYREGQANVQKTVTYQSNAQDSGLSSLWTMDALNGIKTVQIRRSSTNIVEEAPDRINSPTTSTKELSSTLALFTGRYQSLPPEAGPYILEEQVPVPLLFDNEADIASAVDNYSNYLVRFIKGDALGLQISESLRRDIAANWRPGMPFRYYDPGKSKVMAMRMDATSWGVATQESALTTNAIWIGDSNATVTLPHNLQGNSGPDMGSGITSPSPVVPPSVDNETNVDSGSFVWIVNVHFGTNAWAKTFGNDSVIPTLPDSYVETPQVMTAIYISGVLVGPGDLLETENNGSIPLEIGGNLVTVGANVIDDDLFGTG